jgi:hypothetical protein
LTYTSTPFVLILSPYKTKNTWTTQKYKNLSAITWLTNPCNSCQIAAKLFTDAGDTDQGVVTTPGHSASFNANTMFSSPDDWRLAIWRVDFTLLTTSHTAMWYINQ